MELHETPEEGAAREAFEEAEARIKIDGLLGVYTVKHLSQVQLLFRASFAGEPKFSAGIETSELGLFAWEDIPWGEIAFGSVTWALDLWHAGRNAPLGETARNFVS
jgi:8-oxo-dGTP pyrophosphatase MutT (NUDIX family)